MWERFSYYGMRALLVLFMVEQIEAGGLGYTDQKATAIYGIYTAFAFLSACPAGGSPIASGARSARFGSAV